MFRFASSRSGNTEPQHMYSTLTHAVDKAPPRRTLLASEHEKQSTSLEACDLTGPDLNGISRPQASPVLTEGGITLAEVNDMPPDTGRAGETTSETHDEVPCYATVNKPRKRVEITLND